MSETKRSPSKAAFITSVAAIALLATTLPARAESNGLALVGTWQLQVSLYNCATGAPLGPSFSSLHTYNASGSLIEQGSRLGPPAVRARTIGQGIWAHTGGRTYRSFFKFFSFDGNGAHILTSEVTRTTVVGPKGNRVESTGTVKTFDGEGNLTGTNCVAEAGGRLSFAN